ncbi:hypothetical protein FRB93_000601 [Tulasnella sp. JGI-2019a]|nr:hypothetical protein FRB93_000601 [Tulasnella sp. JGI-2019a]
MATPPRKKLKTSIVNSGNSVEGSERSPGLYAPFRALGFITNHVPFVLQVHAAKGASIPARMQILTCVGRTWAMWNGERITLLFVGSNTPNPINSLAMQGEYVWASAGSNVIKHSRGQQVASLENPLGSAIATITVFGSFLLGLTEDGRHLLVWDIASEELECSIPFDNGFTATQVLHPATYLNKVLVASAEGALQLWNIRSQTCIHRFDINNLRDAATNSQSAITALVQSPAVDVVGIGFASGEVSIYDIRTDERLLRVHMEGGGVRSISFRADGESTLATASSSGHIAIWDLNKNGRLLHLVRGAHDGAIVSVQWVPGQAILISAGEDNSLKQWLFDSPLAPPRLLKSRSGHHAPPHLIRYYGDDGKTILTAARDRSLRSTSVVRDSRSHELSQGPLLKKATSLSLPITSLKFPPITALSYSRTRSKDWEDVVTTHSGESMARTWHIQNKACGRWLFKLPDADQDRPIDPGIAKTCVVSACGNFGIVGSSTGLVQSFNLQSGMARTFYELPKHSQTGSLKSRSAKADSVTGLATDGLNRTLVVGTMDGTLHFFDFHSGELVQDVKLSSSVVSITLQRDSGLLAVISDDLAVRIVDVETRRIVRELRGFKGRVLDLSFSPDSRWLVTTSLDSIIRTFDIPSGRLIDGFKTPSVPTSVAFSPTGDFLATSHIDSVGVFLWANRAQYSEVFFKSVREEDIEELGMPSVQGMAEDDTLDALTSLTAGDPKDVYSTPTQLDEELMTLTLLPRSKWQTLLNIEIIQQRNKPKEPPKPPEQAPFFLPSLPGVDHRLDVAKHLTEDPNAETKKLNTSTQAIQTEFGLKLAEEDIDGDYENFFVFVKKLSPAALDVELRSLSTLQDLILFSRALTRRLECHRDFEAVQILLKVFLRIHGETFIESEDLRESLEALLGLQRKESLRLLDLVSSALGTLSSVRDNI